MGARAEKIGSGTGIRGYTSRVELIGDQEGIAALKAIHTKNRDYLKFLLGEIRSNTDLRAAFKAEDGSQWHITLDPKSNELKVEKKA
jgi:hypothetical protein